MEAVVYMTGKQFRLVDAGGGVDATGFFPVIAEITDVQNAVNLISAFVFRIQGGGF